jgi:hypothetical protein
MRTYLLTPAPRSRLAELQELWDSLGIEPAHRVVVTTQPDPIKPDDVDGQVVLFDSEELNISKWWTAGLDHIASREHEPYNVLLCESDARISQPDLDRLVEVLRSEAVVMAGADWCGTLAADQVLINTVKAPVPQHLRLPGVALLVRGELGIRHDPAITFWFADDDFENQHRVNGGTALVGGTTVQHSDSTPRTEAFIHQTWADGHRFQAKWGFMPLSS